MIKISVVTPSFNQSQFIGRTIESVLNQQGAFELEYLVMDGGSTDGTLEILKSYEPRLRWKSEKDRGQSDAINKGFAAASGDILAWLNSDDAYEPGALDRVAETFKTADCQWCFGNCRIIDENDREIRKLVTRYKIFESRRYSYKRLLTKDFISQPAVFFSKKACHETGPLDLDTHYVMDYDYWLRLGQRYEPVFIDAFLADFRWHGGSKCGRNFAIAAREAFEKAKHYNTTGRLYPIVRHFIHYISLKILYRMI
ncbi:MAG: glycosyltransferase [Deltaproteobacteria bacterium]|nr:glycosyltransferase [Deltaproteobacteria bacterium]